MVGSSENWRLQFGDFKGLDLTGLHLSQRPSSGCLRFARGKVATFSS